MLTIRVYRLKTHISALCKATSHFSVEEKTHRCPPPFHSYVGADNKRCNDTIMEGFQECQYTQLYMYSSASVLRGVILCLSAKNIHHFPCTLGTLLLCFSAEKSEMSFTVFISKRNCDRNMRGFLTVSHSRSRFYKVVNHLEKLLNKD
jgi:hypothetical protein